MKTSNLSDSGAIVLISSSMIAISTVAYFRIALARLRLHHEDQMVAIESSPAYKELGQDQQITLGAYIHRSYRVADRKRVYHETTANVFAIVGGVAPLLASLSESDASHRAAAAIAGATVLTLRVFQSLKNASDNQRTAYLINSELALWRSQCGKYAERLPNERFGLLIGTVKTILDTVETSFVGAGEPDHHLAPPPPIAYPSQNDIATYASTEPVRNYAQWQAEAIAPPESIGIAQPATTRIAPEDFPAWQAEQLADEDFAEITQ